MSLERLVYRPAGRWCSTLYGGLLLWKGRARYPIPERWYKERFGSAPAYPTLLKQLAGTPTERSALLRSYFEPTNKEREQGLKVPTRTHYAIADLAKRGYIRMILTTNFDRLIEMALDEAGVRASVVSTDDGLRGVIPYTHTGCTLVKLHGDYRDARIKNTARELASFSSGLNNLLDRVLDEFGLIVCGWSATHDTALRQAILRCPTRRYSTFWTRRGEPLTEAAELIQSRKAEEIQITSADDFFERLADAVQSLRNSNARIPYRSK